jgi:hypothetical protein
LSSQKLKTIFEFDEIIIVLQINKICNPLH